MRISKNSCFPHLNPFTSLPIAIAKKGEQRFERCNYVYYKTKHPNQLHDQDVVLILAYNYLMITSTPEGSSSFIRASMVLVLLE